MNRPNPPNLQAQIDGPQYQGPASFMKARQLTEPEELDQWKPDVAVVGAPWDDSTTYRPGARFGPRAVRVANYQPPSWHLDLEVAPFDVLKVVDYGDAVCPPGLTDQSHEAIRARVSEIASRGIVPMVIGGDHSITYPSATAVADAYGRGKVGMVHFDAHADTGRESWGNLASHATPMRRLIETGAIPGKNFVQLGLRGYWPEKETFDWMRGQRMRWHLMGELLDRGVETVIDQAIQEALDGPEYIYISVDIDVLDPGFAPGTGTPEPGGMQPADLLRAIRSIALRTNVVAMDVVEVSPPYDHADITSQNANRCILEAISALCREAAERRENYVSTVAEPIAPGRVAELIAKEEDAFRAKRKRSDELWKKARNVIPRGVPSSFQDAAPQPVFADRGKGSRIWDVDGNEYVDFHNGFGVMVVGHAHPLIVDAISQRAARGTHFAQPVEDDAIVAAELARRFHQPQWRFTNSGSESTLDSIHLARGFTGRDRIIKIEASYHGHHDALWVSVEPPPDLMGPVEAPASVPYSGGIPKAFTELTTVVPYNNLEVLERTLERHKDEVAAVILEPVMMNIGIVLPEPGFLEGVRDLAHKHGALLIFDEVKTGLTIASGGATERFGVTPDLVALAKALGGGLPCGAVGGRADIMATIDEHKVAQVGTFNGNPLTMATARVTLTQILTPSAYAHFDALAETLQGGLQKVIDDSQLPFHPITLAARGCITYRKERVRNYRDYLTIDKYYAYLAWLYQCNRGVLMAPGAEENWTLSVQHSEQDVLRYVHNFRELARDLTG